jgi:hypothetical protein
MSFYPKDGMRQLDAIDTLRLQAFVDWNTDFDGQPRAICSRGAGCAKGGWLPQLQCKPHRVKD